MCVARTADQDPDPPCSRFEPTKDEVSYRKMGEWNLWGVYFYCAIEKRVVRSLELVFDSYWTRARDCKKNSLLHSVVAAGEVCILI